MVTLTTEAIGVLKKVKASIREEPRRLFMPRWIATRGGDNEWRRNMWETIPRRRRPPCGTAFCIGGGIVLMAGVDDPRAILNPQGDCRLAAAINDLFYDYPGTAGKADSGPWRGERYATAPAACRAIDRFIAEFAPQQKAV